MQRGQSPSLTVVERVARREGVDPIELRPPLQEVVDTDALDALFRSATGDDTDGTIEFTYAGYRVRVDSGGDVSLTEAARSAEATHAPVGESHTD